MAYLWYSNICCFLLMEGKGREDTNDGWHCFFQKLKESLLFVYPLNLVIMQRACTGYHKSRFQS